MLSATLHSFMRHHLRERAAGAAAAGGGTAGCCRHDSITRSHCGCDRFRHVLASAEPRADKRSQGQAFSSGG